MPLELRTGDLFSSPAEAIGHGVNTRGLMGAGVARIIRDRFPEGYQDYRTRCLAGQLLPGQAHFWYPRWGGQIHRPALVNMASQDAPGPTARLGWLTQSLQAALDELESAGIHSLAIPQIGCGIGGLLWSEVHPAIETIAAESAVRVEVWTLPAPAIEGAHVV